MTTREAAHQLTKLNVDRDNRGASLIMTPKQKMTITSKKNDLNSSMAVKRQKSLNPIAMHKFDGGASLAAASAYNDPSFPNNGG